MNSKVIILLLCITMILSLNAMIVDAKVKVELKEECDYSAISAGTSNLIDELNSNAQYLDFIAKSDYHAVKLVIDKTNTEYFVYDTTDGKVKQVDSAKEDFTIKVTCRQINNIVQAYDTQSSRFNRMILNRVPMKAKSAMFTQCFGTDWCKNKILGK